MSGGTSIAGRADWLSDPDLQRLLAVLSEGGEEARIAGGAVRNTLLGVPVSDIDIATTNLPEQTARKAEAAGYKAVHTGAEHGTITVILKGRPFEVTTLRADVETDGRRAKVMFGRNWTADAKRRDFTINGLYAEPDGAVIDLVDGLSDLEQRVVRFIGDADTRIREDYLRILRFFRIFAWYGAGRPDADGLRACARLKAGLERLSAERVWAELKRLLAAPDPARTLLWMRQSGVLTAILPESEKWGIDAIHGLIRAERDLGWAADPLLRLMAVVPPDAPRMREMADRLRMSNDEADRLADWARSPVLQPDTPERSFLEILYRNEPGGIADRLRLALAGARERALNDTHTLVEAGGYFRLLKLAESWESPSFPLKGSDLVALGVAKGPRVGELLRRLESEWIGSGFHESRDALLERAASLAAEKA